MRRVLACVGIAAMACLAALPTAGAEPRLQQQVGQPVINEIQTRGTNGVTDQFIEILNTSRTDVVDLSGWHIQVYAANNTVLQTVFLPEGAALLPLGAGPAEEVLFTVSSMTFTGGAVDLPGVITIDIPSNGGVALFNPGNVKIDSVAFSATATVALEGQPLVPQLASLDQFEVAYGRNVVGMDTDNNQNDYRLLTRSPEQLN